MNPTTHNIKERVKEYYGKTIQKTSDLETNVTCLSGKERMPKFVREALQQVHEDVTSKQVENKPVVDPGFSRLGGGVNPKGGGGYLLF